MDYNYKTRNKGKVREQTKCPNCPSSDAFTVYDHDDGTQDGYCFSCAYYTRTPYGSDLDPTQTDTQVTKDSSSTVRLSTPHTIDTTSPHPVRAMQVGLEDGSTHPILSIPNRMISQSTAERYNVRTGVSQQDGETPIYLLFPRYKDNEQVGWKTRLLQQKDFISSGGSNVQLFGQQTIKPSGKKLWITEGELDCLSLYQVLKEGSTIRDWEPSVASLPDGASCAAASISRVLDVIDQYEEIILVFDNDSAGRTARDECCKVLAGKVSYVDLPLKDANEMLMAGRGTELKWLCLTGARKYQPDGIVNAKDLWDRLQDKRASKGFAYPSTMPVLNQKTMGARPGSIITVTSGTGMGKSQFLRELLYHFYTTTDEKIAGMFLEEDVSDTMTSLLSLHLNKRIHLPNVQTTIEEQREGFDYLFNSGRISFYDYFGGMDDSNLLSKLRYFAITGHRFIFLDHLSIVVSEFASQGGERERIDTLMTKLAKFVKEFDIILFLVVHLRKTDNSNQKSFEEGLRPSLDDLRGSGSLKQLSWDVIGLSRNQQHEDPYCANTTEVCVLKSRFTGRTGVADYLHFDNTTGRLFGVPKPVDYHKKKSKDSGTNGEF